MKKNKRLASWALLIIMLLSDIDAQINVNHTDNFKAYQLFRGYDSSTIGKVILIKTKKEINFFNVDSTLIRLKSKGDTLSSSFLDLEFISDSRRLLSREIKTILSTLQNREYYTDIYKPKNKNGVRLQEGFSDDFSSIYVALFLDRSNQIIFSLLLSPEFSNVVYADLKRNDTPKLIWYNSSGWKVLNRFLLP